jgi:LPXTG-site transpeptidase (sortase) family protein
VTDYAVQGHRTRARRVTRALLYVLAVALIALSAFLLYQTYAPDIRFWFAQRTLSSALPPLPAVQPAAASPDATPTLDFTGWEDQDAAFWDSRKMGQAFARIVSRDAGLDAVVLKGAAQRQLALGPGWITTTDLPGSTGNCAISGHRVTHGHPFRRLERLKKGDAIYLYSKYRRYRYEVDRIMRVTPAHIEVIAHTEDPRLTLTTCDPPGSAVKRLVVQARLVEVVRLGDGT